MNAIYLIDVVIDLSENYENIMKIGGSLREMRYFHFQTNQVIFYQFQMNRKPFMVGNLCGKIVFPQH